MKMMLEKQRTVRRTARHKLSEMNSTVGMFEPGSMLLPCGAGMGVEVEMEKDLKLGQG